MTDIVERLRAVPHIMSEAKLCAEAADEIKRLRKELRMEITVRQALADVIEDQQRQIDKYGLALMMIREGCADAQGFARETLDRNSVRKSDGDREP